MNILLINNTPSFYSAINGSLKGTKSKIIISSGMDVSLAEIQKQNVQMAIINWSRADFDAAGLCRQIRKLKTGRFVFLLVVAARERDGSLEKIIEAGANDFVFKPFGKGEIRSRIKIADRVIKLEEEILRNKKKVLKLVKEDPVTGLFNRRSLLDEVLKEMGRASREMKYMSALIASITNFRELAEIHGQAAMDEVLDEFGRRMKTSCRPYDKLGRYTVSDFLLFFPDSGRNSAEKVAKRIISSIVKKPIYVKNMRMDLSLAIGISELDPGQISKNNTVDSNLLNDLILDSLIKKSEMAVKRAMRMGINKIEIFIE
ncbi:MAG: diguanylate cyclase [Spirochaetes bacterium]|nr:diguanylate cyclase [Spirochaetota bacterium]